MFNLLHHEASASLLTLLRSKGIMLVTAESCTGGLIAALLTEVAGSSDVFDRGFVTYSNAAKTAQLGVSEQMLARHGAVSEEVAGAMAKGALEHSKADIAVSVTGIAGPGGGSTIKPVGLVYIGVAVRNGDMRVVRCQFSGERDAVRMQAVARALELVSEAASSCSFSSVA
jgi:nicotinamide-nucleotide amidase